MVESNMTVLDQLKVYGNTPTNYLTIEKVECVGDPTTTGDGVYYRITDMFYSTESFGFSQAGAKNIAEFLAGGPGDLASKIQSSMTTEERERRRKEMGEAAHEKVVNTQLTDRQIKRRRSTFMKLFSKCFCWISREVMLLTYERALADNIVDKLILEIRRGTAE